MSRLPNQQKYRLHSQHLDLVQHRLDSQVCSRVVTPQDNLSEDQHHNRPVLHLLSPPASLLHNLLHIQVPNQVYNRLSSQVDNQPVNLLDILLLFLVVNQQGFQAHNPPDDQRLNLREDHPPNQQEPLRCNQADNQQANL